MSEDEMRVAKREAKEPEKMESASTFEPQADIIERPECICILADLPGIKKEDAEVTLERGILTIRGQTRPSAHEGRELQRQEYEEGNFYRAFRLGEGLDADNVEATMKNGVLTITIPKGSQYRSRKVEIKS